MPSHQPLPRVGIVNFFHHIQTWEYIDTVFKSSQIKIELARLLQRAEDLQICKEVKGAIETCDNIDASFLTQISSVNGSNQKR